jgi:hypothetical protein
MARDIFTVVLLDQQWMVRFRGRHSQRYAPKARPSARPVEAANKTGMANPDGAQVRVQDSNNVFRTEWTHGIDPPPATLIKPQRLGLKPGAPLSLDYW